MFNLNRNTMKKIMFALCLFGGSVAVVSAQDTQDTTSNQYRTETQQDTTGQSQDQMSQDQMSQGQDQLGQSQDQDRERIQSTELPDAVKRSLEGQEYRGWLVNGAFKATGASDASSSSSAMESDSTSTDPSQQQPGDNSAVGAQAEEVYIVELKNGAQTKTVRFDKDGKKLEGMEEGMENNQYNQDDQSQPIQTPNGESSPNQPDQSSETQPDQSTDTQTDPNQSSQSESSQTEQSNPSPNPNDPKR
jgi:hypothetical protein